MAPPPTPSGAPVKKHAATPSTISWSSEDMNLSDLDDRSPVSPLEPAPTTAPLAPTAAPPAPIPEVPANFDVGPKASTPTPDATTHAVANPGLPQGLPVNMPYLPFGYPLPMQPAYGQGFYAPPSMPFVPPNISYGPSMMPFAHQYLNMARQTQVAPPRVQQAHTGPPHCLHSTNGAIHSTMATHVDGNKVSQPALAMTTACSNYVLQQSNGRVTPGHNAQTTANTNETKVNNNGPNMKPEQTDDGLNAALKDLNSHMQASTDVRVKQLGGLVSKLLQFQLRNTATRKECATRIQKLLAILRNRWARNGALIPAPTAYEKYNLVEDVLGSREGLSPAETSLRMEIKQRLDAHLEALAKLPPPSTQEPAAEAGGDALNRNNAHSVVARPSNQVPATREVSPCRSSSKADLDAIQSSLRLITLTLKRALSADAAHTGCANSKPGIDAAEPKLAASVGSALISLQRLHLDVTQMSRGVPHYGTVLSLKTMADVSAGLQRLEDRYLHDLQHKNEVDSLRRRLTEAENKLEVASKTASADIHFFVDMLRNYGGSLTKDGSVDHDAVRLLIKNALDGRDDKRDAQKDADEQLSTLRAEHNALLQRVQDLMACATSQSTKLESFIDKKTEPSQEAASSMICEAGQATTSIPRSEPIMISKSKAVNEPTRVHDSTDSDYRPKSNRAHRRPTMHAPGWEAPMPGWGAPSDFRRSAIPAVQTRSPYSSYWPGPEPFRFERRRGRYSYDRDASDDERMAGQRLRQRSSDRIVRANSPCSSDSDLDEVKRESKQKVPGFFIIDEDKADKSEDKSP